MTVFIAPIGTPSPWPGRWARLRRIVRCNRIGRMLPCKRLRFHRGQCESRWRAIGYTTSPPKLTIDRREP